MPGKKNKIPKKRNDQVKETALNELEKHLDKMKKILAGAGENVQ